LTAHFAALRAAGFSGVVRVERAGEVLLQAAAGRAVAERPMTENAVFDAASVSKTYTAMAILSLVESGRLSLDRRLGDLIANAPTDKSVITVRQLLTHTAGIVDFFDGEGDYAPIGRDQAVANLLAAPLDFPPGAQHSYSNGGYNILGAIVELRSGQSLDDYLRARVFARAGVDASLDYRRFPAERLASRPFPDGDWQGPADVMPGALQPLWRLWGAGGVFIDVAGMSAVSQAFAEGRIVAPALVEQALAVRVREGDDQSPSAATLVGVIYDTNRGDRLHYHNGGGLLSNADVRNYLDRDTIVSVMSTSRVPGATRASRELAEIMFGPDLNIEAPVPPPGAPIAEGHAARALFDALIAAGLGSQDDRRRFIADHVTPGFVERRGGQEEAVRFFFSLGRMLARPRLVAAAEAGDGSFNFLVQPLEREQPGYDLVTLSTQRSGERLLLDGLAARRVA
jgi:CubicO group peptidase (beta-lactamase class C family)